MHELQFGGSVINGQGDHSKLFVPGRLVLPNAPEDWPATLQPGSLNVLIAAYPPEWHQRRLTANVRVLDDGWFSPQFTIPHNQFRNNQLVPLPSKPRRGIGQVWRASLIANDNQLDCWVLRRIDSGLRDVLELVAGCAVRPRLGLERTQDWPAIVVLYGRWRA
jgi:hypothetical protein